MATVSIAGNGRFVILESKKLTTVHTSTTGYHQNNDISLEIFPHQLMVIIMTIVFYIGTLLLALYDATCS